MLKLSIQKTESNAIDNFFEKLDSKIQIYDALPEKKKDLQKGNFGSSYIATNGLIVKKLDPTKYKDNQNINYILELLENEIVNYAKISELCPNYFCKMNGYYYDKPTREIYIIMENCGIDLIEYIQKNFNNLNIKEWISLFIQIATAVKCLHDNEYAHLDLKPDNITIDEINNQIKLIDAGSLTKLDNTICINNYGTADYMNKQERTQFCEKNENFKKKDIYALGAFIKKVELHTLFNSDFFDNGSNNIDNVIQRLNELSNYYNNRYPDINNRFLSNSVKHSSRNESIFNFVKKPTVTKIPSGGKKSKRRQRRSVMRSRRQKKRQTRR